MAQLEFKNTTALMEKYGAQVILDMISNLRQSGKSASGELEKSLKEKLIVGSDIIELDITGIDYWKYVDQGRKPGKYVPLKALEPWALKKGIPKTALFPISRKIYKKGIKPSGFASSAIKKNKSKFAELVEKAYAEDLRKYFSNVKNEITK